MTILPLSLKTLKIHTLHFSNEMPIIFSTRGNSPFFFARKGWLGKEICRQLPDKLPKLTQGQRRTKKLDPDVAKICELSDLTRRLCFSWSRWGYFFRGRACVRRCLPTLQLADVIWQVIFEHCRAEASTYMQREFSSQASVQDLQRLFKKVGEPARGAKKLWVPSFWAGIFGTMPGMQWRWHEPMRGSPLFVGRRTHGAHEGRAPLSHARHAEPTTLQRRMITC